MYGCRFDKVVDGCTTEKGAGEKNQTNPLLRSKDYTVY